MSADLHYSTLITFYFVSTFACLQMYIASKPATASTANETIVNIIIISFL